MDVADSLRAPASIPRLLGSGLLLFLLAILLARLLLKDLWEIFLLALPLALLLFALLVGRRLAVVLVAVLAAGALALRAYLDATGGTWLPLLLLPVVALTLLLAWRVVAAMRRGGQPPQGS